VRNPKWICLFICVTALLAPAGADAKAPPKGKYDCTIGGSTLFGTLTIKKGGKFSHNGTKGTFKHGKRTTFPRGLKGYKLKFKGGTLNKMKGRWYKTVDGTPKGNYEIALENPSDGFISIYCNRRK
jgi:hypothetical protein